MKNLLGYGGVGDCFIIILKLIEEQEKNFIYTHVESTKEKLLMCGELLDAFNIKHNLIHSPNLRGWWNLNSDRFDKCFNVCAHGKINCPPRDFHWQPCEDSGFNKPFNPKKTNKHYDTCIQVNGGIKNKWKNRHIEKRELSKCIETFELNKKESCWVGTDKIKNSFGTNFSGELSLAETLNIIAKSKRFIGFNSVLLYWALYNKIDTYLFMDHQGEYDIRIHDDWKKYLTYIND